WWTAPGPRSMLGADVELEGERWASGCGSTRTSAPVTACAWTTAPRCSRSSRTASPTCTTPGASATTPAAPTASWTCPPDGTPPCCTPPRTAPASASSSSSP
ncbi:MAG: hypothetical protein AVDCRST_MAG20-456, partial [uncultured Acidimicrobiales bacterium]